jgi:crotonobetainyl-CoA:carnitine CoA-transferase CaiB-like acyl-CoA transferase
VPAIQKVLGAFDKVDLILRAEKLGIPFAPIQKPVDLLDDPHLNQSNGFAEVTAPNGKRVRVPALSMSFDGERLPMRLDIPAVGADGRAILAELGYAPADIDRLFAAGILVEAVGAS